MADSTTFFTSRSKWIESPSFELAEPGGRIAYADFKKSDNIHRHKAPTDGDYRFCFDNTFSSFNRKTVFFEIIIEMEDGSHDNDDWNNDIFEGLSPEEYYDMKVRESMEKNFVVSRQIVLTR